MFCFVAPLALGLAFFSFWLSRPPVNRHNYARIQNGMSEAEVEAILGEGVPSDFLHAKWQGRDGKAKEYHGEIYSILVWYDAASRVSSKAHFRWVYRRRSEIPLSFEIRDALGLVEW